MKKFTLILLVFLLIFTEVFGYLGVENLAVANAENTAFAESPSMTPGDVKEVYDVVAIIVNKDLMNDGKTYQGIMDTNYMQYLAGYDTLKERIDRYAHDIQVRNPGTVVKILEYDPTSDTLLSLITALENIYKNGIDGFESRLAGAVFIGEIALPVVNKNGNRFISMFPLTDFDEKAYVFNPLTQSFERVSGVLSPKVEIWHGIIREPNGDRNQLATFFDKNHLYHENVADYATFDKKLFYADLVHEENGVNEDAFVSYQRFLKNMEDLAYYRYNKKWAAALTQEVMAGYQENGVFDAMGQGDDGMTPEQKKSYNDNLKGIASGDVNNDQWKEQKDILTKVTIDKFHTPFIDAVSAFISVANDLGEQTGRYDVANSQVENIPTLISMKDGFAQAYLKGMNDVLGKKTDEIVDEISKPMPLLSGSILTVYDWNGNKVGEGNFTNGYNSSDNGNEDLAYINGTSIENFYTPKQSYPFLGTMYDPKNNEFTTLTRSVSYDNILTAKTRYGLGVNGTALSIDKVKTITSKNGSHDPLVTTGGLLIETIKEYGIPAFFNNSPLKAKGAEEGDILVSIQPKYKVFYDETAQKIESSCAAKEKIGATPNRLIVGPETPIISQNKLNETLDEIWQKVTNKDKYGGTDKDDFYCDDSTVLVKYYDANQDKIVPFELRIGDAKNTELVPIYSLASDNAAYLKNDLYGCFMTSTILHDDRCFPRFAKYPVIDPAGSYEPYYEYGVLNLDENGEIFVENAHQIWQLSYINSIYSEISDPKVTIQENVKKEDVPASEQDKIIYSYQFPIGENTLYEQKGSKKVYYWSYPLFQQPNGRSFYDIDSIYYDECFNMLPNWHIPLPIVGYLPSGGWTKEPYPVFYPNGPQDWSLYRLVLGFVEKYTNADGSEMTTVPYGGNGVNAIPLTSTVDFGNVPDTNISISNLASSFGLYDGIDNDGNTIADYDPVDTDNDGIVDDFNLDLVEADPKYGLTIDNISMVGRKLLGPNYKWKAPKVITDKFGEGNGTYFYPLPNKTGVFAVTPIPSKAKPTISSIIRHNEPTNYTISSQWSTKATQSLPIDDPRYVAFLDVNGDVQSVDYPNLFKSQSQIDFVTAITDFAAKIVGDIPGARENLQDHGSTDQAKIDYIVDQLMSISLNSGDEGFKLRDTLDWYTRSIDDKHEYILEYYLNENKQAYIHESTNGYETAYLVLDGGSESESDYYDTSFNKAPLEESDAAFDPFADNVAYEQAFPGVDADGNDTASDDDGDDGEGLEYVTLLEFFGELQRFVEELGKFVDDMANLKFKDACQATQNSDTGSGDLSKIILDATKNSARTGGDDYIELTISAMDADGNLYSGEGNSNIKLNLSQDDAHPIFEIDPSDESKVLTPTGATYRLFTTQYSGSGSVSVTIDGVSSGSISISSTPDSISLIADNDSLVAGESGFITLTAALQRDDELDVNASNEVEFFISDETIATFQGPKKVKAENGIATIKMTSTKKAGVVSVTAKIAGSAAGNSNFADGQKDIFVLPGEIAKIDITSDTDVLEANNQSKANLKLKLYDQYGNQVVDTFDKIAIFSFGNATLDKTKDVDTALAGIQMITDNGVANISLRANDVTDDKVDVYAVLQDYTLDEALMNATDGSFDSIDFSGRIGSHKSFKVLRDLKLQISSDKYEVHVGGNDSAKISAILTDASGNTQNGYNGPIVFRVRDGSKGTFSNVPSTMSNGSAQAILKSTTKSGSTEISVSIPGFTDSIQNFTFLPGPAKSISLTSLDPILYTVSPTGTPLKAELKDEYGNVSNSNAPLSFGTSTGTSQMIDFVSKDSNAVSGVANAVIKSKGASGRVNLVAQSSGLTKGTLSLDIKKRVDYKLYDQFSPRALYINLLGGDFYNLGKNDMAASLLFNGKSQAVLSSTASLDTNKREVFVDGYGAIEILNQAIESQVSVDSSGIKVGFTDTVYNENLGEILVVPENDLKMAVVNNFSESVEGILAKNINESGSAKMPSFVLSNDGNGENFYLKDGENILLSLDNKGRFVISDDDLFLRIPNKDDFDIDQSYFSLLAVVDGKTVGQIMFKQNIVGGVNIIGNNYESLAPGFYLKTDKNSHFGGLDSFSRYSTQFEKGAYIVDLNKPIDMMMDPGFGTTTLENAKTAEGVGLRYDNKNLLLFAAGNSAGESNVPYASEVGVLLGDPTIRLGKDDLPFSQLTGFDPTVGKSLFTGIKTIKNVVPFDYNGDNYEDLLLTHDDGTIRLLENEISSKKFNDRGELLNINSGIESLTAMDIDNDNYDDLLIATQEACKKGEVCLSLYKNNYGNFIRQELKLGGVDSADKIYELKTADLNADDFPELMISNSSGEIYIYWNKDGTLNQTGTTLGNFGIKVDGIALVDNLVVNYSGMPLQQDASNYLTLSVARAENYPADFTFIAVSRDSKLSGSSKTITDINGGSLNLGDVIQYTIVLKNNSTSNITGLKLSDINPPSQKLDEGSLKCAGCGDNLEWIESFSDLRNRVIQGISVPAKETRTITYRATIVSTPKVSFDTGDFENDANADQYLDVLVRPDFGNQSTVIYFDSDQTLDTYGHITYKQRASTTDQNSSLGDVLGGNIGELIDDVNKIATDALSGLDLPVCDDNNRFHYYVNNENGDVSENNDFGESGTISCNCTEPDPANGVNGSPYYVSDENDPHFGECLKDGVYDDGVGIQNQSKIPDSIQESIDKIDQDADSDGLPDYFNGGGASSVTDDLNQLANDVEAGIQNAVSALRCDGGGCLPNPYNYAFLAASEDGGTVTGTAIVAWGVPSIPPFGFLYSTNNPSSGRIYLSPTLTMGLGLGVCFGGPTGATGACWPASIPVGFVTGGVCKAVTNGITNALNEAKDFVTSGSDGNAAVTSDGSGKASPSDINSNGSWGGGTTPLTFDYNVNLKIPGFPAILTDWLDKEIEEVFNKLLDLPEFYFIFPEVTSLVGESANALGALTSVKNRNDLMTVLASIPLVQIKGKEVMIKIPSISGDQITKWSRQANLLIKSLKDQLSKIGEYWSCDTKTERKTLCDAVTFKMTLTIKKIQDALDALESYKNLPKNLMNLRGQEQKYAMQIICYLDAIMDLTGGYMKRQSRVIASWMRMISDIEEQLKSWAMIFRLSIDYQASCDECKTDRFNMIGLLMQLFGQIPGLPVIEFPKLPDFVFDFSKLQLGAEIVWPDLVFKPQPITLPDLPSISIPHEFPGVNINLDGLIPDFILDIPKVSLDFDFPDLPPLPLPKLPNLPKPPKIPKLPSAIFDVAKDLRKLFQILCLIKKGLVIIPEVRLRNEIEILTSPSSKAVIPFIKSFAITTPEISYSFPSEIDATLTSKFGVGTNLIYSAVKDFADEYNKQVEDYIGELNEGIKKYSAPLYLLENLDQKLKEELGIPPTINIDGAKIKDQLEKKADELSERVIYLAAENSYFDPNEAELNIDKLENIDVDELSSPYMQKLAEARNKLLSFAKSEYTETDAPLLASTDLVTPLLTGSSTTVIKVPMVSQKIAMDPPKINLGNGNEGTLSDIETDTVTPPGIHVFTKDGQTENILYYTYELGKENHLAYIDSDNDDDQDIVYSLGGDLYLKENRFEESGDYLNVVSTLLSPSSVDEYSSNETLSVQRLDTSQNSHNSSTIKFDRSNDPDVVGYEVFIASSLLDKDSNTYRYLLVENPDKIAGTVDDVVSFISNTNTIETTKRDLYSSGDVISAKGGDMLHALSDSQFVMKIADGDGGTSTQNSELPSGKFYPIPLDIPKADLNLVSGQIELIKKNGEKTAQPLIKDIGIIFGDQISSGSNGGAGISFNNGATIEIQPNEIFSIVELVNPDNPSLSVQIPDGNYYGVIYALRKDGKRSFSSVQSPISPQVCGDDSPPLPALSNTEFYVAVTKTMQIDSSSSFDTNGEIVLRYLDANLNKDSNNDGNPKNDQDLQDASGKQIWNYLNGNPSKFILGPFDNKGDMKLALNLVDSGGNITTQDVTIHVYVPAIEIDPVNIEDAIVTGTTDPPSGEMPYSLMRKRYIYRVKDEKLLLVENEEQVKTPSADQFGQYKTSSDGSYKISDFNLNDIIEILNGNGEVIGEIDAETGNFWLKEGYSYKIVSAQPPTKGTYIEIFDQNGKSMGKIYLISNPSNSVEIHQGVNFNSENTQDFYGVHVSDSSLSDDFEFRNYPSNDPNYPNGVYLYHKTEKKHMVAIDTSGNILLIDERMSLKKKENQFNSDPLIYELLFNGTKVAEIYVSPKGKFEEAQIVGPKDVPYQFPKGVTPQYLYEEKDLSPHFYSGELNPINNIFSDLSGNLYDYAMSLYKQGLISGDEKFNPDELLSRADFVVTLLHMLCIVPRQSAYESPQAFDDMPFTTPTTFYYPYIKEGSLLGLVSGYGGETSSASGLNPFKPGETITLAEAVKVIIQGLEMNGVLDLSKIDLTPKNGVAWYVPYMDIAVNFAPYVKDGIKLQNSFVITSDEAKFPGKVLTRGQILEITYRVIDAYNCTKADVNNNGMHDYCEKKYNITDPNADPDKDDLTNNQECYYGTNPNKYDTDDGGVGDGDEIKYGLNPLIGADDQNDTDGDGLTDIEELIIYHTDPNNPDTDGGGVYDGYEVQHQTDPLYKEDDYSVGSQGDNNDGGQQFQTEAGIYIVPGECDTCPCNNSFKYKSDLRKGDVLYTIIVNQDSSHVYAKSNETKVY